MRTSVCKSRKTNLNDSKRCTESFVYDKLEKSLMTHEINHNKDICIEMLNSFRKGIEALFQTKQVKKKKILRLVDWVMEGILSVFPDTQLTTK